MSSLEFNQAYILQCGGMRARRSLWKKQLAEMRQLPTVSSSCRCRTAAKSVRLRPSVQACYEKWRCVCRHTARTNILTNRLLHLSQTWNLFCVRTKINSKPFFYIRIYKDFGMQLIKINSVKYVLCLGCLVGNIINFVNLPISLFLAYVYLGRYKRNKYKLMLTGS